MNAGTSQWQEHQEIDKLRKQLNVQKKIKNARINNLLRENKDLRQTVSEQRNRIAQLESLLWSNGLVDFLDFIS